MPNPEEASKAGAGAYGVSVESASPAEQGEIETLEIKESLGDDAATEPLRQGSLGRKEPTDTVGTNPKRTDNSRAE